MNNRTTQLNATFKQANIMIQGRQSISLPAKRLLLFGSRKIDATSQKPNEVRITFDEYASFVTTRAATNWKGRTKILDQLLTNLNGNPLLLESINEKTGKRYYKQHNWVQALDLDEDTQEIVLIYSDEVRRFFLYVQNQSYTNTIDKIGQYVSLFTIRIKEIIELEQFKNKSSFDIAVETLKWQLGVDKKYARFYDFKRKVLEVARKELAAKRSPIQFTYDTLGRGGQVVKRGVHSIRIYPQFIATAIGEEQPDRAQAPTVSAPPKPILVAETPTPYAAQYPAIFKKLTSWGISVATIHQHIEQKGIERVRLAVDLVENKQGVKSQAGMYISAIKKGWENEEFIKKQAAKATKKKQLAIANKQQAEKELKDAIASEASTRINRIVDQLIAENKGLLERVYQQLMAKQQKKEGSIALETLSRESAAIYNTPSQKWKIIDAIKALFPERFVFTLADWPRERPLEYKDLLDRITRYYKANNQDPKEQESLIAGTMARTFDKQYPDNRESKMED